MSEKVKLGTYYSNESPRSPLEDMSCIGGLDHELYTWEETDDVSYTDCKRCGMMLEYDDGGVEFNGFKAGDIGGRFQTLEEAQEFIRLVEESEKIQSRNKQNVG